MPDTLNDLSVYSYSILRGAEYGTLSRDLHETYNLESEVDGDHHRDTESLVEELNRV